MPNNLSSDTLFHYTKKYNVLVNIIRNGFKFSYFLEDYESAIKEEYYFSRKLAIPMICLCDIPVSSIKSHSLKYGSYAIGVSKNWAIENKFTPVIYTHVNSPINDMLNEIYLEIFKFIDVDPKLLKDKNDRVDELLAKKLMESNMNKFDVSSLIDGINKQIGGIMKFAKPYKGNFLKNGELTKNVKFYDEKEWRFIPSNSVINKLGLKDVYYEDFFTKEVNQRAINLKTFKKYYPLSINDIRFIIVKSEDEVIEMIKDLNNMKFTNVSNSEVEILKTKIISLEAIEIDF